MWIWYIYAKEEKKIPLKYQNGYQPYTEMSQILCFKNIYWSIESIEKKQLSRCVTFEPKH